MKSNEELMKEQLDEKRKIPQELRDVIDKTIFYNIIMSIGIMTYLLIMNIGYFTLEPDVFKLNMKIVSILLITLTIAIFEIAYKRDSGTLCITGIEMLVLSFIVLYMPFAYSYESDVTKKFIMLTSIFFAIYYVGKLIVLYINIERMHRNSLSDVKEITKKEKNSYLNETSKKIYKKGE